MSIIDRPMNQHYSNFLLCTEEAPVGTCEEAKKIADAIGYLADTILEKSREVGAPICNADGIRNIEVNIYAHMRESTAVPNPVRAAEKIGKALSDPVTRESVIESLKRDRDFLEEIGLT